MTVDASSQVVVGNGLSEVRGRAKDARNRERERERDKIKLEKMVECG
jgi:hypothetical protein